MPPNIWWSNSIKYKIQFFVSNNIGWYKVLSLNFILKFLLKFLRKINGAFSEAAKFCYHFLPSWWKLDRPFGIQLFFPHILPRFWVHWLREITLKGKDFSSFLSFLYLPFFRALHNPVPSKSSARSSTSMWGLSGRSLRRKKKTCCSCWGRGESGVVECVQNFCLGWWKVPEIDGGGGYATPWSWSMPLDCTHF